MIKVVIENLNKQELLIDNARPLLHGMLEAGQDWMHACGGKGRCTTCKAIVLSGKEHFTPVSPAETRYRQQGALAENERLTCQVRIRDSVVLRVPDEGKLPHLQYSSNG